MQEFETLIRQRIAELEDQAESSREATAPVELDQTRQGRLSRMDAMQGQAMAQAADRRRGHELQRLKGALARLDRGEFGECLECGESIAQARLRVDPASTLCVECASEAEGK